MTEQEWLACTDPAPMLEFLRGKASDRKLRLFTAACCRRIWHLLPNDWSRKAVEASELLADDLISVKQLDDLLPRHLSGWAATAVYDATMDARVEDALRATDAAANAAANASAGVDEVPVEDWKVARCNERRIQAAILRDVCGNPFSHVALDLAWLMPKVTNLAQAIYTDRSFDRLPILADALEDAGCNNQDILDHCRQPGVHVRGCWVVDLLLEKE